MINQSIKDKLGLLDQSKVLIVNDKILMNFVDIILSEDQAIKLIFLQHDELDKKLMEEIIKASNFYSHLYLAFIGDTEISQ